MCICTCECVENPVFQPKLSFLKCFILIGAVPNGENPHIAILASNSRVRNYVKSKCGWMVELSVAVEFSLPDLWGCHSGLLLTLWLKSCFFCGGLN